MNTAPSPPPAPFPTEARRWAEAAPGEYTQVLRLAVARGWAEKVHTARTEILATGAHGEGGLSSRQLEALERDLEGLREVDLAPLAFDDVLRHRGPRVTRARESAQPTGRAAVAFRGTAIAANWGRFDHRWTRALAREALAAEWRFWTHERTLPISEVSAFHAGFEDTLWPGAVLLCVEGLWKAAKPANLWAGVWFLVGAPDWKPSPSEGWKEKTE